MPDGVHKLPDLARDVMPRRQLDSPPELSNYRKNRSLHPIHRCILVYTGHRTGDHLGAKLQEKQATEQLAETEKLYERYLELAELADLAQLAQEQSEAEQTPPPTDLPLTVTIH